ncbi:MAG: YlxR family protein [Anaerolineales bacterium]|jgi:predicted RNA-binding protein YlxR (DUF448 family)
MSRKTLARPKHVPQRMCIGCREALAKRALVRVARTPDGVKIDPTGKAPGRGAYVHDRSACWEAALRGPLEGALKTQFTPSERETLEVHMRSLTSEESVESDPEATAGGAA